MTPKLLNMILKGAVSLAVLALLFGAYGANLALQAQSERTAASLARKEALERQQEVLAKARADIETYGPLGEIAKSIVPQNKDQAQTVREIVNIASAHGITLNAITFPSSTLGSGGRGPALSQLQAVPEIPGMYKLELTVRSDNSRPVPFNNLINFLDALEHNRRTAVVDGITLQPDSGGSGLVSFTLNLAEYIKP